MTDHMNTHDELSHYQNLWDAALEKMALTKPVEPDAEPVTRDPSAVELLQERREAAVQELEWRDMLLLAEDIDRVFHPERLQEATQVTKTELSDIATRIASHPNPLDATSLNGKDQDLEVTPDFNDSKVLRELSDLKFKLEALERQIHNVELTGTEKQENSLQKEVASLRSKVEELSEKLTPHVFTNPD